MMQLAVSHLTRYSYAEPIRQIIQSIHLTPSEHEGQRVLGWNIEATGATFGTAVKNGSGDWVQTLCIRSECTNFEIKVNGTVETIDTNGVLKGHRERINPIAYLQHTAATQADKNIEQLAQQAGKGVSEDDGLERAHRLSNLVTDALKYEQQSTNVMTTAAESLKSGRGVCQDYAHILIAAASVLNLPARYVSGYLLASVDLSPEEASHAWAELFIHGLGWVGFDPSGRCCPDARYIRLASGRAAHEAAPIRGVTHGIGEEALDVTVAVTSMQQ